MGGPKGGICNSPGKECSFTMKALESRGASLWVAVCRRESSDSEASNESFENAQPKISKMADKRYTPQKTTTHFGAYPLAQGLSRCI